MKNCSDSWEFVDKKLCFKKKNRCRRRRSFDSFADLSYMKINLNDYQVAPNFGVFRIFDSSGWANAIEKLW